MSQPLVIESTRSGHVESVHRVHVAVVDAGGAPVAHAGEAGLLTFWRSASKAFQALPLVQDGAADAYGYGPQELALACASHSSEPVHRALALKMLAAAGNTEAQLACGPHPPLSQAVAEAALREGLTPTPHWSNCSGKHAGMLALARHRGWPLEGYERRGHPLQERILDEVARWSGTPREDILQVVDGCTAVNFGLPLRAMATAFARLATSAEPAALRLCHAMRLHPELVAGTGRLCTELMALARGSVLAKVGAEGIYCAAVVPLGLGIALKVEDGDGRCSPPALLLVLRELMARSGGRFALDLAPLAHHAEPPLRTTRGEQVGSLRARGHL
ncbi:MAG TPA: asparaginase, partial [Aggregicoccus sp.]|nr:asparaginase [Aggregicoccus sp.]